MDIPPRKPWTKQEDELLIKLVTAKRKARQETENLIKQFDNWCSENYENPWMIEYLFICNR